MDILGTAPAGTVRLLALHHPPFATGPARIVGRGRLVRALVAARVDVVLAGHTHVPVTRGVEVSDGVAVHRLVDVVAGTATSNRLRGTPRSWTVLRIDADAIAVEERYGVNGTWRTGHTAWYPRPAVPSAAR